MEGAEVVIAAVMSLLAKLALTIPTAEKGHYLYTQFFK